MGGPLAAEPTEELLIRLFDRPDRVLTQRQLQDLGEPGVLLRRWGALRQTDTLTSIACRSCGEDHFVDLEFDAILLRWRYFCGSVGFINVDEDDLIAFGFDVEWLLGRLTQLLKIGRPKRECLISGVMWRLGVARTDLRFWTAIVVRDVVRHLDPVLEQLQWMGRDYNGLLLSSSADLPFRVPLPNGYRWLPLRHLLDAESGELLARQATIQGTLAGANARDVTRRPPGRPGVQDLVLGEFDRRRRAGDTELTLAAESAALQSWLMSRHPRMGGRSRGRIENIIRSAHASWRKADSKPTK